MTSSSFVSDAIAAAAPAATNTVRNDANQVAFENKHYRITVSDTGEVRIFNKATGETYRIWGDPHVEIDGQQAFDFWGQTTFQLQDGTKVTIETTPWKGGGKDGVATISSKVTITDGDYAAVITGVDDNRTGDLNFTEYQGHGTLVDANVDDGNVLFENMDGAGFITAQGDAVDQAYIDDTDLLKGGDFSPQPMGASKGQSFEGSVVWQNLLQGLLWNLGDTSGDSGQTRRERLDLIRNLQAWQPALGSR